MKTLPGLGDIGFARHAAQLLVAHRDEVLLDRVDRLRDRLQMAQDLPFADAEDLVDDGRHVLRLPGSDAEVG